MFEGRCRGTGVPVSLFASAARLVAELIHDVCETATVTGSGTRAPKD